MTDVQEQGALNNAGEIIERFGGIRPMASKMNVPVTTVQGWKKRNVIPGNRREDVLRAAQLNNVDLGGLIEKGGANENTFSSAVTASLKNEDAVAGARHREAVAAGERTFDQEALLGRIRTAEKRAVVRSSILSFALSTLAIGCAAFLLWPQQGKVSERIQALETDMGSIKQEQSFLGNLIPRDLGEKLQQFQEQAQNLQARIGEISQQANAVAGGIVAPGGSFSERLAALEAQVAALTGSSDLGPLLGKIRTLQDSIEGQAQLDGAIADLGRIMAGAPADDPAQVEGALQQAQAEDDELGRTLAGVSPTDLKAAAYLLALSQFRHSLNRSAPFEDDLALMRKLAGGDDPELAAAIDRLAPQAAKGVLTPGGLKKEFKGLAGDIVVSSLKGEDVTVKEKAKARLNDILQVQKDGQPVTGTDTQAAVARAQKMLDDGNIQGAIAELQTLEGDAAQTAQPWIAQAQETVLAQKVQDMLTKNVVRRFGAVGSPYTPGGMNLKNILEEIESMAGGGHSPVDLGP